MPVGSDLHLILSQNRVCPRFLDVLCNGGDSVNFSTSKLELSNVSADNWG